jgi:dipeptidyl aminopeptidase/acylaminoacyl peptidase
MTDRLDFETRLEARLLARAAQASRPFDAAAIAHETVTSDTRRSTARRLVWPTMRPGLVLLILAAMLTIALLAVALVGALHVNPPPTAFPIARANGWIAVSANPKDVGGGENGDIYRVEAGSPTRRIIGSDGDGWAQACPRFSPDGIWLAYGESTSSGTVTTFRGNWPVTNRGIAIVRASERDSLVLDDVHKDLPSDGGPIACPEWSPDGTALAINDGGQTWITNVAPGDPRVISTVDGPRGIGELEWARDGRRIAVAEVSQIRIIRTDGGTSEVFRVQGAIPESLGWTAGDRQIVYAATDVSGGRPGLRVLDLATRVDIQLSVDPTDPDVQPGISSPAVSPDGTRVAWIEANRRCGLDGCAGLPFQVMTKHLDGSPAVEVRVPAGFGISRVQWSPAGDRLLLSSIDGIVSVALAAGMTPTVLSQGELNLEWSWDEVTWQPLFE